MKIAVLSRLLLFLAAGLVPMARTLPSNSAFGHKVEAHDAAAAQALVAQGGRLIEDYGSFQLYDVPQINGNFPASAEMRDGYNSILLNAIHLNTSTAGIQALRKTAGAFNGKRMHLVHFAGPVQPAWRQSLLDAGVQIVSYIPQNAYLVYGDADSIGRVQAMAATAPHIQWEGAYLDDYKIHPRARTVDKNGNPRQIGTDQFAIQMMADADANAATLKLIDQLKLAPVQRQRSVLHFVDVVVRLPAADLAKIAARPDVLSIQPFSPPKKVCERQDEIIAGNLSGDAPSGPGYLAWLESKGFTQAQFTASGFVVDVSDSGIDNGTTAPNHFGLYSGGDINSPSRVAYNILEGTPNQGSTLEGCDGHGNLNSHIISGYDDSADFPFEDSSGYHYGLGVCPFVSVGSSVIFDPDNSTNPDDTTVISTAYHLGARISNNSWGDSNPSDDGTYSVDSFEYDALVRDAQPSDAPYPAAGNQEMVIVFAAGNDGPTAPSVSPPGTAKNVITVGGAQNVQPFGGEDCSGVADNGADNANAIIDFSGRGPCNDGRRKPDIVAPSTHVSGGAPQASRTGPTGDGSALACFLANTCDTSGVSGGVGTNGGFNAFFPDNQEFYTASSGTSHSTPAVTGGCALVRQYFLNNSLLGTNPPSPAMTKAFLMNSARYMTGSGADDTLWSESQGMGEMDLGLAFDGTTRLLRDEAPEDMFTASGQSRVFTGTIGDSTKPFRVTMGYTDAPGSTTGAAYNNDLDLTVTIGGNTYKGNVFSGSNSITGGAADAVDNVKSVFLPPGVSGNFTVTITAASINSIGVPNASNALSQDFALVVYNTGAAATLAAAGYTLTTNEPCTNGVVNAGETVTVNLALQNVGTAPTTNLVGTLLMGNGVVFPSGPQTYGALAAGASATNTFSFLADGTCGQTIAATLQLQDGTNDLGTVSYSFQLGMAFSVTNYTQNFDGGAAGTLPLGWSSVTSATDLIGWSTESTNSDTAPNAAWCPDAAVVGEVYLYSPTIATTSESNQLSFRNDYNLEETYDGGVLQIAIGGGSFNDILTAGGSFVTGGYNGGLTDLGDRGRGDNPLIGLQAWTGSSGGFITTIVNLPAAAAGTNVQFRWICGTDRGNDNLSGAGGWWIDTIAIIQPGFDCTNCPATNTPVPVILFPTNGDQFTAISTAVEVAGLAPADSTVTISDNGILNTTVLADGNGVFVAPATLNFGPNTITAAGATDTSSNVAVYIMLGPPILDVPPVANPPVTISGTGAVGATVYVYQGATTNGALLTNFVVNGSGVFSGSINLPVGNSTLTATEAIGGQFSTNTASISVSVVYVALGPPILDVPPVANPQAPINGTGAAGATVYLYEGASTNGTLLTNFVVNALGNFSGSVTLPLGSDTLTATETVNGQTSTNSSPISVLVVATPPPAIVSPATGLVVNKAALTVSGKGIAGAVVTLFDFTGGGTNTLATALVNSAGKFSTTAQLVEGVNTLFATQEQNGGGSPASAPVVVSYYSSPVILVQPANQTNFLKGTVTFAAVVSGAAPLTLSWETNGVKIRGASGPKLTLSNLKTNETQNVYSLLASNKYGVVNSVGVTVTLVTNPFTNLAGAYYGLFAESNAQFESSGLLTLTLTPQGKFTARILNAGGSYAFSGALSGVGWASNTVSRGSVLTPLAVVLDLNTSNGMEQILGTVSAATNWSAALEADRATYNADKNPFPTPGKFTLLFGNTNSGAQRPGGDGYGLVSVSAAGMVSLSGVLSNNTSVAPGAVSISRYGRWPLYIPLYGKSGSLEGWIDFTNTGMSSFAGSNAAWFRINADGKLYPGGFTNSLTITGSIFSPDDIPVLAGQTNLEVILSGGNLADVLSNSVTLLDSGKFSISGTGITGLTLTLSPSTGVIKGSFTDPATQTSAPIKGVVFPDQTNAAGFFLNGTNSGSFLLTP